MFYQSCHTECQCIDLLNKHALVLCPGKVEPIFGQEARDTIVTEELPVSLEHGKVVSRLLGNPGSVSTE